MSIEYGVIESMSIPHQRRILDRRIEELDISNAFILEFVDNGVTGTMMDRPALQEMLELVQIGKINCVIIKDFSRFSRNIVESGYFIDRVFPLFSIRLISVSDKYDSANHKTAQAVLMCHLNS